jgi:hypothetical protein
MRTRRLHVPFTALRLGALISIVSLKHSPDSEGAKQLTRHLLGLAIVSLAACDAPTNASPELITETASSEYVLGSSSVSVLYSMRNATTDTLWLGACGDRPIVIVEMWDQFTWTPQNSGACRTAVMQTPIPVSSGEALRFAISVHASTPRAFRLRPWIERARLGGEYMAEPSNIFWIR